jgi:predicted phosphate transport protein (TIGR00153 family)
MLKIFKKRTNIFVKLIHDQASFTLEGMDILKAYLLKPDQALADQLNAKEKEADEARRILIEELNRNFITPFDREDIFTLSRAVDDVLDYAYSTMIEIEIFKIETTEYMVRICSLLRDAAFELMKSIECLQNHPGVAAEHTQRAKALENRVETVYREALADMFQETDDVKVVVKMMKLREVYRHLSNAADRGDEAANVLADILVKST